MALHGLDLHLRRSTLSTSLIPASGRLIFRSMLFYFARLARQSLLPMLCYLHFKLPISPLTSVTSNSLPNFSPGHTLISVASCPTCLRAIIFLSDCSSFVPSCNPSSPSLAIHATDATHTRFSACVSDKSHSRNLANIQDPTQATTTSLHDSVNCACFTPPIVSSTLSPWQYLQLVGLSSRELILAIGGCRISV